MPMNSSDLLPFLGMSELDPRFPDLLALLKMPPPRREAADDHTAHIELPADGLSIAFEDEVALKALNRSLGGALIAVAAQLYANGYRGYRQFAGSLPDGIEFSDDRRAVRDKLGEPAKAGGGVKLRGRMIPALDRFDFPTYSLHLTYDDDRVKLVSLIAPIKRASSA